ncbi:cytochrome c peroxidase [Leptospira sp. 96542]|nr:cytochrome c peroxidase [Leptospira sp. 96542]
MLKQIFTPILMLLTISMAMDCGPSQETKDLQTKAKKIIGAIPKTMPGSEKDSDALVSLGKKLYFEKKLSANESQSCNSCHNIEGKSAGVDNLPTSPGAFGKNGDRNSPTVLNAGFHFVQFWDGRAADLKTQAKGPILNPVEMAMPSEKDVLDRLSIDPEYPSLFEKAFPGERTSLTYDNLASAIAAFERTLVTESKFDDFINGDTSAISKKELEGFQIFISVGCTSCHSGNLLGGQMYQKLGLVNSYETKDLGRYSLTKKIEDKYVFKVPSLRNITLTGPYFHDGSVTTIENAVEKMAFHQLGKTLTAEETSKIVAFLHTLSDKKRAN